jgi:sec-independent protein translocase protein TatA
MMGELLQPTHLLLVLLVALLLFGPRRLPELGRSIGRGLREFKEAVSSDTHEERGTELKAATPAAGQGSTADKQGAPSSS